MVAVTRTKRKSPGFLETLYNSSALGRILTDAYHFTTGAAYANEGREQNNAVFYLFGRKEGLNGGYTVAAGLELLVDIVNRWKDHSFSEEEIAFLKAQATPSGKRKFTDEQIERFVNSDLQLKIDAVPEGTLVFPQEPLLRVEGPVDQAKMLESVALCIFNGQSAHATHAARLTDVLSKELPNGSPRGSASVQGLRRGPSVGSAFEASRALELGGYTSTSTGAAAQMLGQVFAGTMDHAWVMTHDKELGDIPMAGLFDLQKEGRISDVRQALKKDAFRSFAFTHPEAGILLVDTYDPVQGLEKAIVVIKELHELGLGKGYGVRFDSGDLVKYSKLALRRFVQEGMVAADMDKEQAKVDGQKMTDAELLKKYGEKCASFCAAADGIDEYTAQEMREQGAFFKSWGVGTGGSHVSPLGEVYKASSMEMEVRSDFSIQGPMTPVMKVASHAPVKSSNPGKINSCRVYDDNGKLSHVVIYDEDLGLDPQGKAVNLRNFEDKREGMSSPQTAATNSLLVPIFDKDCNYVYAQEPPKRETFKGSDIWVTDLSAIAATVKQQLGTLTEGVRRIVRPRDEIIKGKLLGTFKTASKAGETTLNVDIASIMASLPPEVEHVPVFLDQKLFNQRTVCEAKHSAHSSGVGEYTERFDGGNATPAPGTVTEGNLQLQGGQEPTAQIA